MMMRSLPWLLLPALLTTGAPEYQPAPANQITAVSLSHSAGEARLTIGVRGSIVVHDSILHSPERVILDFDATGVAPLPDYDHQRRGHVIDVKVTQLDPSVARLVLQLDQLPRYTVDAKTAGQITIAFTDQDFTPWSVGTMPEDLVAALIPSAGPAATSLASPAAPVTSARAQQDQNRLSFDFVNEPCESVFRQFSMVSGRNIVPGSGVINANCIVNVRYTGTWRNALAAVLQHRQLSMVESANGDIRVDSPTEIAKLDSLESMSNQQIKLNYAKASLVRPIVASMLTKNRGAVEVDSATNSLVVTDTPTALARISAMTRQLDVKTTSVAIEVKLIFVDRTDLSQLGVKYDLGDSKQFFNKLVQRQDAATGTAYNQNVNVVNLYGSSVAAISNADAIISGSALDLIFSTAIGGYSVTSFLSALDRIDLSDIEATQTLHTNDNQEAEIHSGEETPVRVTDISGNTGPGTVRATVSFKETGIMMKVKPHVTNNNQIFLDVYAERSSVQLLSAADLGYNLPKQWVHTQLLLNNGQPAMMGGMVVTTITKGRSGIPLLGRLPFLGPLFSFTSNTENRKELIIMVTPRIVDNTAGN